MFVIIHALTGILTMISILLLIPTHVQQMRLPSSSSSNGETNTHNQTRIQSNPIHTHPTPKTPFQVEMRTKSERECYANVCGDEKCCTVRMCGCGFCRRMRANRIDTERENEVDLWSFRFLLFSRCSFSW
jgi:hypothetical protein